MVKTSDHRHQPAHDGSISAGFGLLAAMWWLQQPSGLWHPNQVAPVFHMGPFGWPTARNANTQPFVGLLRGPTSTSGWCVDGAPYHQPNVANRMDSLPFQTSPVDAWFDPIIIDNMRRYQRRRGLRMSFPPALCFAWNRCQNDLNRTANTIKIDYKIDVFMHCKRIICVS